MPYAINQHNVTRVERWKADLIEATDEFIAIAGRFNQAAADVKPFYNSYISPVSPGKVDAVVNKWFDAICEEMNAQAVNQSTARISIGRLPKSIQRMIEQFQPSSWEDLGPKLIRSIDFNALEIAFIELKGQIQSIGLQTDAKTLAGSFGFVARYDRKIASFKKQKNRILLRYPTYGSNFDIARNLRSLKYVAKTFESESGLFGLVFCLQQCINLLSGTDSIPSRTRVAEDDSNVSATFYNGKIVFHFDPTVFEGLVSFMRQYAATDVSILPIEIL